MTPHDSERIPAVIDMARANYARPLNSSFQDEEPEEARLPLSQYLWILKRYRWRILGFCVAAVVLTVIVSARLTPIYEATTTVDIDRATPSDVVGQDSGRSAFTDAEQFLATQMKLVESDSVLRPVDQRFALRKLEQQSSANGSPEGEASPVKLKQLKVTRPPSTYLMQVSYRSSDPVLAADAANAIAQSYLEHTYNIRVRSSANMATFMERQLEELKTKMEQSGKALVGFERDLSVINPEEKTNILSARLLQLNTDYVPSPPVKNAPPDLYFHFDSWRANPMPGVWIPDHIYVEEEPTAASSAGVPTRFKAQTRIWDFAASPTAKLDELTQILVDSENHVKDQSASRDVSPLESQRAWERQAEENVLSRLEKSGLLAPAGPVDDVLNTVVDNLIISGKLNADARCRVLLTTPIETFSIGHTIVISRGLIDVLPDEASLALVLAVELSHIVLGHRTPTQFAFYNQTMLNDADLLARLRFERTQAELDEAGAKTIEIMRASPYQKTANAGLFLKALASRSSALPRLLAANLGNQLANTRALERLSEFTATAPELEEAKLEQIAALPLGSRIKLNPWTDQISLAETKPVSLLSAREKMPFEITPSVPFLTLAH
jgi:capsular polysaccharide biosynthesis protein